MKILVAANQKGGVGKTCTIVNLAHHLAKAGIRTLVLDLDVQGNASYSLSKYSSKNNKAHQIFNESETFPFTDAEKEAPLVLFEADARLVSVQTIDLGIVIQRMRNNLRTLSGDIFDCCLIDTPPVLGISLSAALACADYVLSPIELEVYSLQGIKKMVTAIKNIQSRYNDKLSFLGMLPCRVDTRSQRQKSHLRELGAAYPELLIPHSVILRTSVADALATKKPIWEVPKRTARDAAQEIGKLNEYLTDRMGLSQNQERRGL